MSEARRRDWLVAGGIFLIALVLRAIQFREVALHDPYYALPTVDDLQYDLWARRLAAGEGLIDGVLYLGPGYPAFMAGVYWLVGASLPAVKAVQTVLGAASAVLVFGITREVFDRRAAAIAGLLTACHAMLVFYGGTIMTVNLTVPLVLGLVWMLVRTLRSPGVAGFAASGALLGLAVLVQQTILPLLPLVLLWILFGMQGDATAFRRAGFAAAFAIACFAFILPITIHNAVVGRDFVLLNSMGGPNFYMGNQREADGTWQVPYLGSRVRADNPDEMQRQFKLAAERATGRAMKPSEISSYWMARGIEEIRADPLRWIALELRKLGLHFNAYEVWNIRSIELSRETSGILRLPLVTMGFMAPLGLLGILLSLSRWRELVALYGVVLVYLAGSLLFFVLARYRLPGVLMLLPFAAFAVVRIADELWARNGRWLLGSVLALALLAALVHLPLESSEGRMHMAYYNLANKYRELERWDEAIAAYQKSLRLVPGAVSTHNNLALAYELGGRRPEAVREWQLVRELGLRQHDRLRVERADRHLRALESNEPVAPPGASPP